MTTCDHDSILERIDHLPPEIIDLILEKGLFSEWRGSHQALHYFRALSQCRTHPNIRERVELFFSSKSLQTKLQARLNLFSDFDHVKSNQLSIDETAPYDLASLLICVCFGCTEFLIAHKSIEPSSFCKTGESIFWLAVKCNNLHTAQLLLSWMDPKQLLDPFYVTSKGAVSRAILGHCTQNQELFQTCWGRLKLHTELSLPSLEPYEAWNICLFADIELASSLLARGIDLGKPHIYAESPWLAFAWRENSGAMFEWLWKSGHRPPRGLLPRAAESNNVQAVQWILDHFVDVSDWLQSVWIAAVRSDSKSADMLEAILKVPPSDQKSDGSLDRDLITQIVLISCTKEERYRKSLTPRHFHETIQDLEETAARKIRVLANIRGDLVIPISMKVKTKHGKLHKITEALENLEWKNLEFDLKTSNHEDNDQ